MPYFLGIDPGLSAMGLAVVETYSMELQKCYLIKTIKDALKKNDSVATDNLRRCRQVRQELVALDQQYAFADIAMESFSAPRHASSAAKYAMSVGIIWGLFGDRPVLQATPQEIKIRLGGKRSASKNEVRSGLEGEYSNLSEALTDITKGQQHHAVDGLAALVTCMDSDQLRMTQLIGGA